MKKIVLSGLSAFLGLALCVSSAKSQDHPASAASSLEGYRMEDAVINVAATTGKAVVSVSTEHTTKFRIVRRGGAGALRQPDEDEALRRFFNDFFGEMPEKEFKQVGLGSGVIISADGSILTNQHVIDRADKITVTLPDGRQFKAEVKGEDKRSDLAIIKINAGNLTCASLGDSDNLRIGQWVVAIGNPFAFALQNPEPTVTVGVISALHRALGRGISQEKDFNDLIQTDAAINPGNSGGPLVNLKGEVVALNVAIFSTSGGYQGIGFAIPINNAKRIIASILAGKKITYGWMGVSVQDLNDDLARYFVLPDKRGALVSGVMENSPALKAGLKEGDVIRQFDARPVNNVRELLNMVGKAEIGRRVNVLVVRDKTDLRLEMVIAERPQNPRTTAEEPAAPVSLQGKWRGLTVEQGQKGVLVAEVGPDSFADKAGMIPDDLILEINRMPVKNLTDYKKIIAQVKGNCLIRTIRGYFLVKEGE